MLKKLIKSRKGVAIELAVGVMFLMMAFTIMLLSGAGIQNSLRIQDYEGFNEMVEVNDIGEYVLANRASYNSADKTPIKINEFETEYTVSFTAANGEVNDTYTIYKGDDTDPVLTIIIDNNGTDVLTDDTITSWK